MNLSNLLMSAAAVLLVAPFAFADGPSATSPDGKRVAAADGKVINVIEVASGKIILKVAAHTGNVTTVAFSPDGKLLASAGADDVINVLDAGSGVATVKIGKAPPGIVALTFTADGKTLIASGKDKVLRKWDAATGKPID
jgi:WD40 repeat protein